MKTGDRVDLKDGKAKLLYLQQELPDTEVWLVQYEGDVRQYSRTIPRPTKG